MKKPDLPADEEKRLNTLKSLNILDSAAEERFDRLTRMAKRMFDVPIALVSLVDENRQWFKSCIGLPVLETPRDISFCGHAILGDDVFIIPDAAADVRFADNPLVTGEPFIRFYAGCPLTYTDGSKLGTLCIIDREPRDLTQDDLQALRDIASTVERELAAVQMATLDELTDIPNRRGFMMIAQHSINLCARQRMPATLVYMDLNKLKPVNDTYGHAEGDRVLKTFAEHISAICRESDLFARLGGDEFAILFVNTSKNCAEDIIRRLQQSLQAYNQQSEHAYDISFSFGIVDFISGKHLKIDDLLSDGDELMYQHKKQHKAVAQG